MTPRRLRTDEGSVTVQVAIMAPVALALLCLVALVGRTTSTRAVVNEAARDAARAGSIQRDPVAAEAAARQAATDALTNGGVHCATTNVTVDVASFAPGDDVTVTIACDISLSDLGLIGLSGTRNIASTSTAIIDVYRSAP